MANEPTASYPSKYSRDYDGHSMGYYGHEFITDDSFADKKFVGFVAHGGDANVTYTVNCGPPAGGGTDVTKTFTKTFTSSDFPVTGQLSAITVNTGEIRAWYQAGEPEAGA